MKFANYCLLFFSTFHRVPTFSPTVSLSWQSKTVLRVLFYRCQRTTAVTSRAAQMRRITQVPVKSQIRLQTLMTAITTVTLMEKDLTIEKEEEKEEDEDVAARRSVIRAMLPIASYIPMRPIVLQWPYESEGSEMFMCDA